MRPASDKDSIEAAGEVKTGGKDHIETLSKDHIETLSKDQVKTAGRDHIEAANVDQIEAIETQRIKDASPVPFLNLMMDQESARAKEFRAVVELECLDSSYLEFARQEVVLCFKKGCGKIVNSFQDLLSSTFLNRDIRERIVESLNMPKDCNLSFSLYKSNLQPSPPPSSPPPSYSLDPLPPTYFSSSTSTLLEFSVLLTQKENELMSGCLDRIIK